MLRSILAIFVLLMLTACGAPAFTAMPTGLPSQPAGATTDPTTTASPTNPPVLRSVAPGVLPGAVVMDDSFITIYGEFENIGSRWLHNIQIVVTYYDESGSELYQDKAPTEVLFAGPGERVPFYIVTGRDHLPGAYASHQIEVTSIENDQPGARLKVDFTDQGVIGGVGEINGTVTHDGQGTCTYPSVAVVYYDAAGKVLAVSSNYLEVLEPGAVASFRLYSMNLPAEYGRVEAMAACREINGTPAP